MPTTRARLVLTETDELARALDAAARRWPQEKSRAALAKRLMEEGRRRIADDDEEALEARREAIRSTSGILTGVYPPGYLEELRQDWPP